MSTFVHPDPVFSGGEEPDSFTGTAAADSMFGAGGDDTLAGAGGNDLLRGEIGNDSLLGGSGNDSLVGGEGDDRLFGNAGNDTLEGSAGNDTLDGGLGRDVMRGGAGDDEYRVDYNNGTSDMDLVIESLAGVDGGHDRVLATVSYTLPQNVETLLLLGDADLDGTGNALPNRIDGNAGNNHLVGGGGNDSMWGGPGIDLMKGGAGNDTYYVDDAADDANERDAGDKRPDPPEAGGGTNIDTVIAQVSYTLRVNIENLQLVGDANLSGNGNSLNNILTGNNGDNLLRGQGGIDLMAGGVGNDTLDGGTGDDTLNGGGGNDTYILDNVNDEIRPEGSTGGNDTVQSSLNHTLGTNLENLVLTGAAENGNGNSGNNTLNGNGNDNVLKALGGNDRLLGFAGIDRLSGGAGRDTLTGGGGADRLVFDTGLGSDNIDQLTDFVSGTDKVLLDDDIFSWFDAATATSVAPSRFQALDTSIAQTAQVRIIYNTNNGALFYDQDGDGPLTAIRFATLVDAPTLSNTDFVIIG